MSIVTGFVIIESVFRNYRIKVFFITQKKNQETLLQKRNLLLQKLRNKRIKLFFISQRFVPKMQAKPAEFPWFSSELAL